MAALRRSDLRRTFGVALAAGVFLGLLGPFGMGQIAIGLRLVYWVGAILIGTLVGVGVAAGASALLDREGRRPFLVALVTAAAMTPAAAALILVFTRALLPGASAFGSLGGLLLPVFVVSLGMTGVNALADRRPASDAAPAQAAPPRFLARLPPRLRGAALFAVEAEDHYLRVHTDCGSDLILLRLADAIAELDGVDGAQTHRSWWVARAAVREARRGGGRATLVLASGLEVPVSRGFATGLREKGWF